MAGSSKTLKNVLDEWMDQNFPSGYTSCIKIQGRPILPPLMSEERRIEMRHLRDIAISVEDRLRRKKESNVQEESAGGEAMYEGMVDELPFANSLPNSLAANPEESTQAATSTELFVMLHENPDFNQALILQSTSDMIKEFDPLAEENQTNSVISSTDHLLDLNPAKFSERIVRLPDQTVSKPGSAESSVALSCSTDLNNYMDITEGSVDVSMPCSDVRSTSGTEVTTPSTIQPDSPSIGKSHSSVPWRDGKTTYEDLNNYLDSLLNNNSSAAKKQKRTKDNNENVMSTSSSSQSSQKTVSPLSCSEVTKSHSRDPPPLTSPQGSLQTRTMSDNNHVVSPTLKTVERAEHTSDFLQSCALSPVVRSGIQNSYDEKVQLYLQNLMLNDGILRELSQECSRSPQHVETHFEETVSSKDIVNGDGSQTNTDANFNGYVQAPPRLVRSNSYTLDSPSPMLLAHMEAELRKNGRNEPITGAKPLPQNSIPSRRVWDVESNKNMPSWCNRQSNASNANVKTQSPKKVLNRSVSAQPSVPGNLEGRVPMPDTAPKLLKDKVASKCTLDQPKVGSVTVSHQQEISEKHLDNNAPPVVDNSKDTIRTLLLQLQLQHKQEMEELMNRQRKEAEAIRLALLEEQRANSLKPSEESVRQLTTHTGHIQSPPTKEKVVMERRNTSPSFYEKETCNKLKISPVQSNKSSSVSLDNVKNSSDNASLLDIEHDERALNNKVVPFKKVGGGAPRANSSNAAGFCEYEPGPANSYGGSCEMITSFPPCGPSSSHQLDSMTSSLPPEILSLHFSNTALTFKNADSVSCTAQSSVMSFSKPLSVPADITSVAQNILSSAFGTSVAGGSPQSKRRSWCSRQLFPEEYLPIHPDWVTQSQEIQKHQAAAKIQAGVRGYLTRRLLKTERVQNCITTIRDTIVCALQLQRECAPHVEPSDLQLHGRLIQQLSAACEELHTIFMGLPIRKRMAIISSDRERLRIRTPRSQSSGSRPLSRATQIALQRKMSQTDPTDTSSVYSRASSASRSRRRSWATVESRVRASPLPISVAYNCEVISGCLSRSSAPTSLPLQRSASAGSSRKPWR